MEAADLGMATLAGMTYSPWTSYLHVKANSLIHQFPNTASFHVFEQAKLETSIDLDSSRYLCTVLCEKQEEGLIGRFFEKTLAWSSSAADLPSPDGRHPVPTSQQCSSFLLAAH